MAKQPVSDLQRQRRRRNWFMLAALLAFVVIIYIVGVIKMQGP